MRQHTLFPNNTIELVCSSYLDADKLLNKLHVGTSLRRQVVPVLHSGSGLLPALELLVLHGALLQLQGT